VRGDRRIEGELVDVQRTQDAEVMVPDETHLRAAPDFLDHLVRTRPVPDEVAEAPDRVRRVGVDCPEDSLERV